MARFTADPIEIQHMNDIDQQLLDVAQNNSWKVKVVLSNGTTIIGRYGGTSKGNNLGENGFWAIYGEATIVDSNGQGNVIDVLDIVTVATP